MRRPLLPRILDDSPSRRQFLRAATWAGLGTSASGWLPSLARALANHPDRRGQCIVLWMAGGPSQIDTFDMKPGHAHGGEFAPRPTAVPGIAMCEHLPRVAQHMQHLAVVRSLHTKEGDHGRASQLMHTGVTPGGPLRYPSLGSLLSKELGHPDALLPNYISIGTGTLGGLADLGPGFLGPRYAATTVGPISGSPISNMPTNGANEPATTDPLVELGVDYLQAAEHITAPRRTRRQAAWQALQQQFLQHRPAANAATQDAVYQRAQQMLAGNVQQAFDLGREPDAVRRAYGPGMFGQGCLLARRLIERGVRFVEVVLGNTATAPAGWDTHQNNFVQTRALLAELDAGWGSLMTELADRQLLENTTILWLGEFGRTPAINANAGRDHFPQAWSCVLGGGGIAGGQVYGSTSHDGMAVDSDAVDQRQLLATLCQALGVSPATENTTPDGRPIKIVDGTPIPQLLR